MDNKILIVKWLLFTDVAAVGYTSISSMMDIWVKLLQFCFYGLGIFLLSTSVHDWFKVRYKKVSRANKIRKKAKK